MYTTVQQCHVAIDYELQQINSNRKQAINPAYYDMALNEAVLQFIETRSSAKQNLKREGFEESQKRYDDLKDLKRRVKLPCNVDSTYANSVYTLLPGDYLKMIPSEVAVSYSKQGTVLTSNSITRTLKVYDLSKIVYPFNGSFVVVSGSTTIDISDSIKTVKTSRGKFYAINVIIDTLRRLGYDVYYETFDSAYSPEKLYVLTSNAPIIASNLINNISIPISVTTVDTLLNTTSNLPTDQNALELVSSGDVRTILDNYHSSRNRHTNPICDLIGDRLNVYYNNTFAPVSVILNYIKKPRLIDHLTNTMCEITVPQEVIKLAVLHLKGILKDEGYNISANEKIINE